MPAIFFSNLWMLAGLTALAVPVLIHLLLKRKQTRVRFSTVRFFLRQDEQASRRRKLRHWLLLSLRLLICTLLVLAFARPYLQGGAGSITGRRQALLVLDRSLSMQTETADGSKWVRAKAAARQVLAELKPTDRAALIGCGVRADVLSEWAPAEAVNRLLADLAPTCGTTGLGEGLQQARRLVSLSDPAVPVSVYIISDLQKSGCTQLATAPLPQDAQVKVVPVGDLVTPNVAVTDLVLASADAFQPHVQITSFSDEDVANLKVEVTVDHQLTSSTALSLPAGGATNLALSLPKLKPGWHDVRVQLSGHDALPADDTRFASISIPEPTHVLVVETRPGTRSFEEESFFITSALDPSAGSTNSYPSRFAVEKTSLDELATRLGGNPNRRSCDLVVLPGLKQLPSALGPALTSYLQEGGGLLVFAGEGVSANRYNAEFRGWLPAQLGRVESSRDWESAWRIGPYATNLTVFGAFQAPGSGDLALGRFTKRFELSGAAPDSVAARFADGTPFVITRQVGRGRVVLVNTSADASWSDWPKHKTFVPWLHGTAHYLAGLTATQRLQAEANLIAGVDREIELGPSAAKASFSLRMPHGKEIACMANERGQLLDVTFPEPGVYCLRDATGAEVRRLAVNVPATESDLTSLSAGDFQQQLARSGAERSTTLSAGLLGVHSNHRELWRVLLMGVLGLLIAEILLANRTVG